MIRSTLSDCVASSPSSSRPPPATSDTVPSGSPALTTASRATVASTAFECVAIEDPRSTIAFPDLMQSAEQSMVTFGRASYTTATTPSGTRTFRTSSPLGRRWPSIVSPTGSGSAAIVRTSEAIPASRSGVSFSRSSSAPPISASSPASMSRAFASRISSVRLSRAEAIACSAAARVSPSRRASTRDASRAVAQIAATEVAVVAIETESNARPSSIEDEVVAVHSLLARAWKPLAHLVGLQALDLTQLVGGVVNDPLADRAAVGGDVDRVARLEVPLDLDHAHRQQRRAALSQRPLGPGVDHDPAVRRLRVLEPQLEAGDAPALDAEGRALALTRRGAGDGARPRAVQDRRGDARRRGHLRRHHLRAHAAGAERRGRYPDLKRLEPLEVVDLGDQLRARIAPRIGGVEPVRVGQEQQALGVEQDRQLGGEEVVVAERDLIGGGRVVLVDHRHDAPIQQL